MQRRTLITYGRLAIRDARLQAVREAAHGLEILTIEQFAARLAGGFVRTINKDTLRAAILRVLPRAEIGELEAIKALPGFVRAAVDTFSKVWLSGIDLQARRSEHPRIAAIACLERALLQALPGNVLRPPDVAKLALARIAHARAIFGDIEIHGLTELSPCWRVLFSSLAAHTTMRWNAGPRDVPSWLADTDIEIETCVSTSPEVRSLSAATAKHEAIEALRWVRGLVASRQARPEQVAIATTAYDDYDDALLALRSDANLDIHFAHGIPVTATREGQACAALADIILRGLSRTRMHRLFRLSAASPGAFESFPSDWLQVLPAAAPLTRLQSWRNLIEPKDYEFGEALLEIVQMIDRGTHGARETGEALLAGKTLAIWRKALLLGPPESLEQSIEQLRTDDELEPGSSVVWAPASFLAASPRPFVYLLGLNSQRWPHLAFEDRLLSEHIIPASELDPLPVNVADTRDFTTILGTTTEQVVLSRARRDSEGRLLGRSALLAETVANSGQDTYLRRHRTPGHAYSESDRLCARPDEFAGFPQAKMAGACWKNWHSPEIVTANDGLVRASHPVVEAMLQRSQSANSLRLLLRNPIGFLWRYGLGFSVPERAEEPLNLDARATGELVHAILEQALVAIESDMGMAGADEATVAQAVESAAEEIAESWLLERPVPPKALWQKSLFDAREQSKHGLNLCDEGQYYDHAHAEVPFGGAPAKSKRENPWDSEQSVEIPQAGFFIRGYIDRLDLSADGKSAWVRDYKTGKSPKVSDDHPFVLDRGRELQRCLYAYAARAMLGPDTVIRTSLHYLKDKRDITLIEPELTLETLAIFLEFARKSMAEGNCVIGADAADAYDDLAFALPANAVNIYCRRKLPAARAAIGYAAGIWDAD